MYRALTFSARRTFSHHFLVLLFTLAMANSSWAKLTATADRTVIDSNETLQLLIRVDAQAITSEPNFDVLENDFKILSNNRQQQYSMMNGRTESYTDWQLTLAPKRTGRLLIPSMKYKQDISDAIQVTVRQASPSNSSGQPVYTETLVDNSAIYVQQQLLLTLRLYTSIQLNDLSIDDLVIPSAITQKVSENQFRKRIRNKDYIVVEIKYAIFPQSSGKLDIPAINIGAYQVTNNNQFGSFRSRGNRLIRSTEAKTIDVMAKPAHIDSNQWMPSSQLEIAQQWSGDLSQLAVGEPLTRTITITAKGLTGAQILPLNLESSNDFKVYPEQAKLEERNDANGVIGIRQESFALVPNRQGEIILPEISVRWWDTNNQRMQTATLDEIRLNIRAASNNSSVASNSAPPLVPISLEGDTLDRSTLDDKSLEDNLDLNAEQQALENASLLKTITASGWMQLSLAINALLLTVLITLLLKNSSKTNIGKQDAEQTTSTRLLLKQRIKAIEIASREKDLTAVREGILAWGRSAFPDARIKTLGEIAEGCAEPRLTEQFTLLDQSLYNRDSSQQADIKLLINCLKGLDVPSQKRTPSTNSALKPLYPSNNIG